MNKFIARPVSMSFVLAVAGFLAGPVAADTEVESWESASLEELDTMGAEELADSSGRDKLTNVQSIQELDASVSNSSFNANTMTTGAITIEQQALENFEGVGLFNIFTGHNNAVNSAVGISVYLAE
ncbi:hypothetical protein [Marinobacter sp. X15-166B]|uniref:hypothetical protein n=1 Tax=Marinobacter sp. X15-166B TaxID=1897620 RepID=UPI00085C642A|nr:hypothetical protein [Marinobacter sp. X15-166B]OEY65108.1 hypothetical protein BG841_00575 [Marinobacter sp. X15-166B]